MNFVNKEKTLDFIDFLEGHFLSVFLQKFGDKKEA